MIGNEEPKSALELWLGGGGGGGGGEATVRGDGALTAVFPPGGATTGSALPGCCDDSPLGWLGCRTCPSMAGAAGEADGEDGAAESWDVEVEGMGVASGTVAAGVELETSGPVSAGVAVSPCAPVADVATRPDSTAATDWAPLSCGQDATATAISARIGAASVNVLTAGALLTGAAHVRRQRVPQGSPRLTRSSSLIS